MNTLLLRISAALIAIVLAAGAISGAQAGFHICGDPTNDGVSNSLDALLILQVNAGLAAMPIPAIGAADVNDDGEVDATDALFILQYDAGLIETLDECFGP